MDTATIVATAAAGFFSACIAIIAFFVKRVINDVKSNTGNIGKVKGKVELIEQQQENDIKRIEENTQLKLDQLTTSVQSLTDTVGTLVKVHIDKKD